MAEYTYSSGVTTQTPQDAINIAIRANIAKKIWAVPRERKYVAMPQTRNQKTMPSWEGIRDVIKRK